MPSTPFDIGSIDVDDDTKFLRIFGDHQARPAYPNHFHFRDGDFITDLKARVSGLAARDNRARNSGWLIDFSPVRTDELTERSLFQATFTSPTQGERRLSFQVGRDWVEMGDGAMQSSVRDSARNLDDALESAFRRVVLRGPSAAATPAGAPLATG